MRCGRGGCERKRIGKHGAGGAGAGDEALEKRIGGEAIGAVHSGAGGFAGRVKPGERGAAAEAGADAAHEVVRGGADGDQIAAQIEAVVREECADAGKARDDVDVVDVAHVEIDGTQRCG